jgi:hypothetical protein
LSASLPKDTIIVEGNNSEKQKKYYGLIILAGYKEFRTDRTYMAKMGDWRQNKDDEVMLDGIGGVNIVVKGDVHRSGIHRSATSTSSELTSS